MPARRAPVLLAGILLLAACGGDDAASPPTSPPPPATADTGAADAPDDTPPATAAPTTAAATTVAPTSAPATTEPAPPTAPPGGDVALLCTAFEDLFAAGLAATFAAIGDPELADVLILAMMPALVPQWTATIDAFPIDGISPEFEATIREVTDIFEDAAAAVRAAGIDDDALGAIAELADVEFDVDPGAQPDPDAPGGAAELRDVVDDEVIAQLAAIDFDLDARFAGVDDPDEAALAALCPSLAPYLDTGVAPVDLGDACAAASGAVLVVFWPDVPDPEPYDGVDPSMCTWSDGDTELIVSLVPVEMVRQLRDANEAGGVAIEDLDALGDAAWLASGVLLASTADGTGGRGGSGGGRATVGVELGDTGVLVAVVAPAGDPDALAIDVADELAAW